MTEASPALEITNAYVHFGEFQALRAVNLTVHRKQVVGLIGPNGAGKSTLINLAAGFTSASPGDVRLNGQGISQLRPHQRARLGLARTFQTAQLFDSLPVNDNINLPPRGITRRSFSRHRDKTTSMTAHDLLAALEIERFTGTRAGQLSAGDRKLVELVKAMNAGPIALLLDEPLAGVPHRQRNLLLDVLREYVEREECGVLLVEHDMRIVSAACDWIYVIDAGCLIAQGRWADISSNDEVVTAYLGTGTTATESKTLRES